MHNTIDDKDLMILSCLRSNSRISLTRLSRHTNIPVSTVFDKLKQYQNDTIKKHTSLINFSNLGYSIRVNMLLSIEKNDRENAREFLTKHPNINSLYKINNGYDFMVEGIFRQINDMENFSEEIDKKFNITDKKSFFIIDEIKKEAFMSEKDLPLLNEA